MSIPALLICRCSGTWLTLGKPLFGEVGPIRTFSYHDITFSDAEFARALWTLLERCSQDDLVLCSDEEADFDELVTEYAEIGGLVAEGDIPMPDYLADHPAEPMTYAKQRPGHPRSAPGAIVRRRGAGPTPVDEAFTRNLRWETHRVPPPRLAGSRRHRDRRDQRSRSRRPRSRRPRCTTAARLARTAPTDRTCGLDVARPAQGRQRPAAEGRHDAAPAGR